MLFRALAIPRGGKFQVYVPVFFALSGLLLILTSCTDSKPPHHEPTEHAIAEQDHRSFKKEVLLKDLSVRLDVFVKEHQAELDQTNAAMVATAKKDADAYSAKMATLKKEIDDRTKATEARMKAEAEERKEAATAKKVAPAKKH